MSAPPSHRATSAHLQAAYPFAAEAALGASGVFIGRHLLGGSFCFDPWQLYHQGVLTNPNVVVIGQIGRGKSTFIKTFLWRQQAFGRQAWIVDPKGEYGALARICGSQPLRIAPGATLRLNPLDLGPVGAGSQRDRWGRRQAELLASLASASLGRPLGPPERTAVELSLRQVFDRLGGRDLAASPPILPDVITALFDPDPALARSVRTDAAGLAADGRQVALELRRLVEGDLAGMFDAPTSPGIDLGAPLVALDLSALYATPALGILMTCAAAWLQAALANRGAVRRLVVVDEAWAILHDLATARWLQASFKLSRAFGVTNVAVLHRLSDLRAAGGAGSEQQLLAEGLLADSETRVVFGQPPSEVELAGTWLGLTSTEAELLPHLPRGVALWKVADRSFLVEHRVGRQEQALVDTDAGMRYKGDGFRGLPTDSAGTRE